MIAELRKPARIKISRTDLIMQCKRWFVKTYPGCPVYEVTDKSKIGYVFVLPYKTVWMPIQQTNFHLLEHMGYEVVFPKNLSEFLTKTKAT